MQLKIVSNAYLKTNSVISVYLSAKNIKLEQLQGVILRCYT